MAEKKDSDAVACIKLIYAADEKSRRGRFVEARSNLATALPLAQNARDGFAEDILVAWSYCSLLVQYRQSPESITPQIRNDTTSFADRFQSDVFHTIELFQPLMLRVLIDLSEFRRALPFAEGCLAIAIESKEAGRIGTALSRLGQCYWQLGRRDHTAIVCRASVRIFRKLPGDSRLPIELLTLGNAVRKSTPAEAEVLYKEAAAIWEAKGQLEPATSAWMNLAVLYSDDGRFEKALDHFEHVRHVREASPATAPVRIGTLYNNLASCYRKMGRFDDAHVSIERAIGILSKSASLKPGDGNSLAGAHSTKGMILRDEGLTVEAIEWFRRARTQFESHPSPNLSNVIEELEHEEDALTHLGRDEEAHAIRRRLEVVREEASTIPPVSSSQTFTN